MGLREGGVDMIHNWRFFRMLQAWCRMLKMQRRYPNTFLFLFLEEVIFLPKSILNEETRPEVFISCGVISCLLKDIKLDNADLVIQVPGITELEIPIQYDRKIHFDGRIKKLGLTKILKIIIQLRPDVVKALEKLYDEGEKWIGITAQLKGIIDREQNKPEEITRTTHSTAYIKV